MDTLATLVLDGSGNALDAAIQWTSTADSVASVSPEGVVTGLHQGQTTVTATVPLAQTAPAVVEVSVVPGLSVSIAPDSVSAGATADSTHWECHYRLSAKAHDGVPGDFARWADSQVEFLMSDGSSHVVAVSAVEMADRFRSALLRRGEEAANWRVARDEQPFDLIYSLRYTVRGELRSERVEVGCLSPDATADGAAASSVHD